MVILAVQSENERVDTSTATKMTARGILHLIYLRRHTDAQQLHAIADLRAKEIGIATAVLAGEGELKVGSWLLV